MRLHKPYFILVVFITFCLYRTEVYAQNPTINHSEAAHLALEHISQTEGTPFEQLLIVNEHPREYPLTQRQLWGITVLDQRTAKFYELLVDVSAKQVLDPTQVEAIEQQTYLKRYDKLDMDLYTRLQTADLDEVIPITIRLITPNLASLEAQLTSADANQSEQVHQERLALFSQTLIANASPLVNKLEADGQQVYVSEYFPLVMANLTPPLIQRIMTRSDVAMIYLAEEQSIPAMDFAIQTQRINEVWNTMGVDGSGINIAILEDGRVDNTPGNFLDVIATRLSEGVSDHPTWVASIAASNHSTYRGVAFGAKIISANHDGSAFDKQQAFQWAMTEGAHIINTSEISYADDDYLSWLDNATDFAIRYYHVTVIAAAGNQNSGNHIGSPGKAYGVITVGGIDDHDNPKWTDDEIYDRTDVGGLQSAWKNPRINTFILGDREKPEVVAVGEDVTIFDTNKNKENEGSGTSLAAPQVTGLAALMMDKNIALKDWPEAVKAIIMTSAVNNIEPPSIMRYDSIDDKDGAGAIVGSLAVEMAAKRASASETCYTPCWWAEDIDNTTFPESSYRYYKFWANAGEKIRVTTSWLSNAWGPPGYDFNTLDTNLNLLIFDPDGQHLASQGGYSASWDNSYEIVEFEAAKTGQYWIGVYKYAAVESSNRLGVAWTRVKKYDAAYLSHTTPGLVFPDQNYRVCFTLRNDGYFEWPVGGGNPVHLGYHWYDSGGTQVPVGADYRTGIGANRPQGDVFGDVGLFCGWVRTPAALGQYTLRWDMVYEGVTWFADAGDDALSVSVSVVNTIYSTYLPIIFKGS